MGFQEFVLKFLTQVLIYSQKCCRIKLALLDFKLQPLHPKGLRFYTVVIFIFIFFLMHIFYFSYFRKMRIKNFSCWVEKINYLIFRAKLKKDLFLKLHHIILDPSREISSYFLLSEWTRPLSLAQSTHQVFTISFRFLIQKLNILT